LIFNDVDQFRASMLAYTRSGPKMCQTVHLWSSSRSLGRIA
jgi:hypothetical protein